MLSEEQRTFFESKIELENIKKTGNFSIEKKDLNLLSSASKIVSKREFIKMLYPLQNRYKLADFFYSKGDNKNGSKPQIISWQILLNELPKELR